MQRQNAYRALFDEAISKRELGEIREAANKTCVLGGKEFKQWIENLAGRRVSPLPRGGDRKSARFRNQKSMGSE